MRLPEHNPDVFYVFKDWLYYGSLKKVLPVSLQDDKSASYSWSLCLRLYALAEMILASDLQNEIMDAMVSLSECYMPPPVPVQEAFDQTNATSPLHKFLIDYYVNEIYLGHHFRSEEEVCSKDFMYEIAKELSYRHIIVKNKADTIDRSSEGIRKSYHVHRPSGDESK